MNILLTGATGFLGSRTLEILKEQKEFTKIIASGRTIKKHSFIKNPKVEYVLGDLTNENYVQSLLKDIDVVIHAAALSSPWGEKIEYYNANVKPMELILKNINKSKIKHIVFISTPSMYFETKDRFNIKESDPLPKKIAKEYAITKIKAENLLKESGIPYVILRPRALIGRGDTVIMPRLIKAQNEGKLKIMGTGKNMVDLTSVANAVDAILLSIHVKNKGLNQTYNISNGNPDNLWDTISLVLSKLNMPLSSKKIPFLIIKNVAKLMELKSNLTSKKEPTLTFYGVTSLTKSLTMNIDKAKDLLGYNPQVTTSQSVDEFVEWYKKTKL